MVATFVRVRQLGRRVLGGMVFHISKLCVFGHDLLLCLFDDVVNDLGVGGVDGSHFGKHLLQVLEIDLLQGIVPVLPPVVVLLLLLCLALRQVLLHAVV
jgi:hypothetical protein